MTPPAGLFWRQQVRRRLAVVGLYAGYLTVLILCALISRGTLPRAPGFGLIGLAGLGTLFGLAGVLESRRTLFLATTGALDERQQSIRDRAYYSAYRVLSLIVAMTAFYLVLRHFDRLPALGMSAADTILLAAGTVLFVLTLPSGIMAWTEAEPPEDSGAYNMINRRSL